MNNKDGWKHSTCKNWLLHNTWIVPHCLCNACSSEDLTYFYSHWINLIQFLTSDVAEESLSHVLFYTKIF